MYPFLPVAAVIAAALGRCVVSNGFALQTASALSADIAVAQVTTVNVTAATAGIHTVRVQAAVTAGWGFAVDESFSYTPDGSPTQAEITAGLVAAAQANPILGAIVTATAGTNLFTLTGTQGGASFDFTVSFTANPSTDLTQTATTAAADAPTYLIGRFVEAATRTGANIGVQEINAVTPSTITYVVTHGAGATYSGTFTAQNPDGIEIPIAWTASAGANLAATLAAIDVALTAATVTAIPGSTVVDTTSPNVVLTLPAGWIGVTILTSTGTGGGGSPAMTATAVQGSAIPTYYFVRDPMDTAPVRGQPTNTIATVNDGKPRPVPIVLGGLGDWAAEIASDASITSGAQVYVETAAGLNLGRATPTPSPTAAPVRVNGQPVRFAWAETLDTTLAYVTI